MGEQMGLALCKRAIEELAKYDVNVLATASDGDRSYIGYQSNIFKCYPANWGIHLRRFVGWLSVRVAGEPVRLLVHFMR
jgi:hypothetical protein